MNSISILTTTKEIDFQTSFVNILTDWGLTSGIAKALWLPIPVILVIVLVTLLPLVGTWLERKISAAAQQRIGPEYIGSQGILVPVADVVKLVFKEVTTPTQADPLLFTFGPLLIIIPIFLSFLIISFGQKLIMNFSIRLIISQIVGSFILNRNFYATRSIPLFEEITWIQSQF